MTKTPDFKEFEPLIDRRLRPPYPSRPELLINFLGWPMTVCIAIACDYGYEKRTPKVIFIADRLASGGTTSIDRAQKLNHITENWYVMFAGNDTSFVTPILGVLNAQLGKDVTEAKIAIKLTDIYQTIRKKQVQDAILQPLGLTLERFLSEGKNLFPATQYAQLFYRIESFDLGCQFLVAGFGKGKDIANIFHVQNPGILFPSEMLGFSAIGSGAANALSYLALRELIPEYPIEMSLYAGLAAKGLAEKAPGVGTNTVVGYVEAEGTEIRMLNPAQINQVKGIWENEEKETWPRNILKKVSEVIGTDPADLPFRLSDPEANGAKESNEDPGGTE